MVPLILKRTSLSRPSGQWRDDDYDVLEDGVVVGRIFKSPGAPQDRPWMVTSGHNGEIRRGTHGYAATARRRWRRSQRASSGQTTALAGPFNLINSFINCTVPATD
jgi:hypothetical protein